MVMPGSSLRTQYQKWGSYSSRARLSQLGSLPAAETRRNLSLFAAEVLPVLRARFPELVGAPA
jgi:hypothetical protein